jgi:hypothetical protein
MIWQKRDGYIKTEEECKLGKNQVGKIQFFQCGNNLNQIYGKANLQNKLISNKLTRAISKMNNNFQFCFRNFH